MSVHKDPVEIECPFNGADLAQTLGDDVIAALHAVIEITDGAYACPLDDFYNAIHAYVLDSDLEDRYQLSTVLAPTSRLIPGRGHEDYQP